MYINPWQYVDIWIYTVNHYVLIYQSLTLVMR